MRKPNTIKILSLILAAAVCVTSAPLSANAESLQMQDEMYAEETGAYTDDLSAEDLDGYYAGQDEDDALNETAITGQPNVTDADDAVAADESGEELSDDTEDVSEAEEDEYADEESETADSDAESLTDELTVDEDTDDANLLDEEDDEADEESEDNETDVEADETADSLDADGGMSQNTAPSATPETEWLREGATNLTPVAGSKKEDVVGTNVYSQIFTYQAGGKTYRALYFWSMIDGEAYLDGYNVYSAYISGYEYRNITDVILDDSITEIKTARMFEEMESLSHVRLSAKLRYLAAVAFEDCTALKNITIPKSLKSVAEGGGTFSGCTSLESITFEPGITKIPDNFAKDPVGQCALKTVYIPSSVKEIGGSAFYAQGNLENVIFTDPANTTLSHIGLMAFCDTNLSGIVLPKFGGKWKDEYGKSHYPAIEGLAFAGIDNTKFKTFIVPEGVSTICDIWQGGKWVDVYLPSTLQNRWTSSSHLSADSGLWEAFGPGRPGPLQHIYYNGTEDQFFKKAVGIKKTSWRKNWKTSNPEVYAKLKFKTAAPKQVSGITPPSGKTAILKYYEDIPAEGTSEDFDVTISPANHIKETKYKAESSDDSIVDVALPGEETEGGKLPVRLLFSKKVGTAEVNISGGLATAKIKVVIKHKPKAQSPVFKVNGKEVSGTVEVKKGDLVTVVSDPADNKINIFVGSVPDEDYRSTYPNGLRVGEDIFKDASKDATLNLRAYAYDVDENLLQSEDSNITLKHVLNMGDVTNEDLFMRTKIPTGLWIADTSISNAQYTGKAITCSGLRVFCYNKLLTKKEYTVKYENNVDAGEASVTVTGKGKYAGKGTDTKTFEIQKVDISDGGGATVRIDGVPASYAYTGAEVPANVSVIVNGRKLVKDTDYTLEYEDESDNPVSLIDSGDYGIKVTGKGNYTGIYKSSGPTIEDPDCVKMSEVIVSRIKPQQLVSAGTPVEPAYTVTYQGHVLEGGFLAAFKDNTSAGTAKLILFGDEEETPVGDTNVKFSGVKQVTFTIKPANLRNATVSVSPQTYTGKKLTPAYAYGTVLMNGTPLTYGKDYTVSYKNNVNAGRATMTIKGKGSYTGTKKANFVISKYALQDADVRLAGDLANYPYTIGGAKPAVKVTVDGITQTTKNYTVSYSGNSTVGGTATVTVKGKGSISGTVRKTFTVDKGDLSKCRTSFADKFYAGKPKVYVQKFTVKDTNGKKLRAGKDYDTEYTYLNDTWVKIKSGKKSYTDLRQAGEEVGSKDIIPAGTSIKIKLTGKSNYENVIESVYRIGAKKVSSLKFSIPKQHFTGDRILPGKDVIKGAAADQYEIISYGKNISGTGTVTVRGIGNYAGTKTIKFKIQ